MPVEMQLLAYAELYSIEYQRLGLKIDALKADLVSEAICRPHFNAVDRFMAMQAAVDFVDIIIAPVWDRIAFEAIRARSNAALAFVERTRRNDN